MDTSPTEFERAVASAVRAEVASQRLMHKEVQKLSGVKPRAYSYYFIQQVRHIPIHALESVSEALGLKASEMLRRAEVALVDAPAGTLSEHIVAQLSPDAQEQVREAAALVEGGRKGRRRSTGQ